MAMNMRNRNGSSSRSRSGRGMYANIHARVQPENSPCVRVFMLAEGSLGRGESGGRVDCT